MMLQLFQNLFTVVMIINALIVTSIMIMVLFVNRRQKRLLLLLRNNGLKLENDGKGGIRTEKQQSPPKLPHTMKSSGGTGDKLSGTISRIIEHVPLKSRNGKSENGTVSDSKIIDKIEPQKKNRAAYKPRKRNVKSESIAPVKTAQPKITSKKVRTRKTKSESGRPRKSAIKTLSGAEAEMLAALETS